MKPTTKLGAYLASVAFSLTLGTQVASAHPQLKGERLSQQGHNLLGQEFKLAKLSKKLGLSHDQQTKVEAILDNIRPQAEQISRERAANRQALRALNQQDNYDQAEAERLAKAQGDLTTRMITLRNQTRAEIFALLTPEQRQKVQAMAKKKWLHKKAMD